MYTGEGLIIGFDENLRTKFTSHSRNQQATEFFDVLSTSMNLNCLAIKTFLQFYSLKQLNRESALASPRRHGSGLKAAS